MSLYQDLKVAKEALSVYNSSSVANIITNASAAINAYVAQPANANNANKLNELTKQIFNAVDQAEDYILESNYLKEKFLTSAITAQAIKDNFVNIVFNPQRKNEVLNFLTKELQPQVNKVIIALEVFIDLNQSCFDKVEEAINDNFCVLEFGTFPGKTLTSLEQSQFNREIQTLYKRVSRITGGGDDAPEILFYMDGSLREYIKTGQEAANLITLLTGVYIGVSTANVKIDEMNLDTKIKSETLRKVKIENDILETQAKYMNDIAKLHLSAIGKSLYVDNSDDFKSAGLNEAEVSKTILESYSVLSKTMSKGGYSKLVALPPTASRSERKIQQELLAESGNRCQQYLATGNNLVEAKTKAAELLYEEAFSGVDVINDSTQEPVVKKEADDISGSVSLQ
ncbi:hypothetical protein ABMA67_00520 [Halobacteriovorax sp. RZ-3]|uniref:hypothetical protein n=1 Tax=Halobacteriovorax sp. RZ-3 TaxID=3157720 RepID=UPI00371F21E0